MKKSPIVEEGVHFATNCEKEEENRKGSENSRKRPSSFTHQGQRIQKEGKVIESPEDNLVELTAQAKTFVDKQLPILKALRLTA